MPTLSGRFGPPDQANSQAMVGIIRTKMLAELDTMGEMIESVSRSREMTRSVSRANWST